MYSIQTKSNMLDDWMPTASLPTKILLHHNALEGFAGEFVYEATKNSEASPTAVLLTFLARFGCEVFNPHNQAPYFQIGESKHFSRLFVAICGQTAKARKGTSAKPVERLFTFNHTKDMIQVSPGPLSSGEGLIYAVRDEKIEYDNDKQSSKIVDAGATDKRLFVLDEELASALKVTKREGNTLSTVLRGLWDNGSASPITKSNRISTTHAHVCIVAHITKDELSFSLQNIELLNGFGNRFLWALVHRSKLVALPTAIPANVFNSLQSKLLDCLHYGRMLKELIFDTETQELWCNIYPHLSRDKPGLIGAVTDRAEAQTARLALIYALLDKQSIIEPKHLHSALAVWQYCEDSAKIIFSGRGEQQLDDKILSFLQAKNLTTTEINNHLGRNTKSSDIKSSLERLINAGLVKFEKRETSGRPVNVFSLNNTYEITK